MKDVYYFLHCYNYNYIIESTLPFLFEVDNYDCTFITSVLTDRIYLCLQNYSLLICSQCLRKELAARPRPRPLILNKK